VNYNSNYKLFPKPNPIADGSYQRYLENPREIARNPQASNAVE
jgi:hypothetical protein